MPPPLVEKQSLRERVRSRSPISIIIIVALCVIAQQGYMLWSSASRSASKLHEITAIDTPLAAQSLGSLGKGVEVVEEEARKLKDQVGALQKELEANSKEKVLLDSRLSELAEDVANKEVVISELQSKLKKALKKLNSTKQRGRLSDRPEVQQIIAENIGKRGDEIQEYRPRLLPAEDPDLWQQRVFKPHGLYGYIQMSGYRSASNAFAAPGLVSRVTDKEKRLLQGCRWVGNDGSLLSGQIVIHRGTESFDKQYETGVLVCTLERNTSKAGGHVIARLDDEEFVMFQEDPLKENESIYPTEPYKYFLTFCSPPFHDSISTRPVWEWMEYHRILHNVSFFQMYDVGGIDGSMRAMLKEYIDRGMAEITDMTEVLLFYVVTWGQKLAIADCIYRYRYHSKWLLMGDLDEYIQTKPPLTVYHLLSKKYYWKAFLSYGAVNWDVTKCTNKTSDQQFLVERMHMRRREMHCVDRARFRPEFCHSAFGHRKYFLNPRMVVMANVHDPLPYEIDGYLFFGMNELWHNHFRGMTSQNFESQICSKPIPKWTQGDEQFMVDTSVAELTTLVHQCRINSKNCVEKVAKKRLSYWRKLGIDVGNSSNSTIR